MFECLNQGQGPNGIFTTAVFDDGKVWFTPVAPVARDVHFAANLHLVGHAGLRHHNLSPRLQLRLQGLNQKHIDPKSTHRSLTPVQAATYLGRKRCIFRKRCTFREDV